MRMKKSLVKRKISEETDLSDEKQEEKEIENASWNGI